MAAAATTKDFDFYKLYVCLLGTFAIAFCRHLLYVEFWHWTADTPSNRLKPLHWALIRDGLQPLSIRCPSNQTQEATPGLTFHQLTFPDPVVLSGSDVTFFQTPTFFEIGLTRVTFTATDSTGNTERCSFYVNLRVPDDTPPSLICPANQTEYLSSGETSINITLPPPVHAVDNSGGIVDISYNPMSGQPFTLGITQVTITATDPSDNSETCVFYVIIEPPQDTTPPVVTCPDDQIRDVVPGRTGFDCYLVVTYPEPTATDDSGAPVDIRGYPASGSFFDTCTYRIKREVEITATDTSGNEAVCKFWVIWSEGLTTMAAPTTGRPTTTVKPTTRAPTTRPATTTRPPTTTKQPTTTRPPLTTRQPTTTRPPTTTKAPTTTRPPTTTKSPTTTRPPTTTKAPTTTRPPTTTKAPTTTRPPTTTKRPTTTRPPTTTTPPTTTRPSTTTKSPTTTKPPVTTKSPTTTRPSTTTKPPVTTRPPATTTKPSTTRPTTKPTTTSPSKTTKRSMTTKGRQLATDFDICNPNPCNNGLCLKDSTNSIIDCICLNGYMGSRCELAMSTTNTNRPTTETSSLGVTPPSMSAIIAVIIGALAFILIIFIILTCIICCYNRDSERPKDEVLREKSVGTKNPTFILDALDNDDVEKLSLASHELVHVDDEYIRNKNRTNALQTEVVRTPVEMNHNGKTKPKTSGVTFADVTPSEDDIPADGSNGEGDFDEVASNNSDHSYQSIGLGTSNTIVVEVDNHLPEADREEASKEAAMLEEIFNNEGLVRIPSTVSTNYSTMSVKLRDNKLNSRYIKRK